MGAAVQSACDHDPLLASGCIAFIYSGSGCVFNHSGLDATACEDCNQEHQTAWHSLELFVRADACLNEAFRTGVEHASHIAQSARLHETFGTPSSLLIRDEHANRQTLDSFQCGPSSPYLASGSPILSVSGAPANDFHRSTILEEAVFRIPPTL
jgi:hypothetical protein